MVQLGSFYIWTYTFQLIKNSSLRYLKDVEDQSQQEPNKDMNENEKTCLLSVESQEYIDLVVPLSYPTSDKKQIQLVSLYNSCNLYIDSYIILYS